MSHAQCFFLDSELRMRWFNKGFAPMSKALHIHRQWKGPKWQHCSLLQW